MLKRHLDKLVLVLYKNKSVRKMFAAFGQFASTSQFYLYGRSHCTRTGWETASKSYTKPDILEGGRDAALDLTGKVFLLTGANAGLGREMASFLAIKKATLYMVCRSAERGMKAKEEICAESQNENVHLIVGDCSLEKSVRCIWKEFTEHQQKASPDTPVRLDALICNAGALLNELTLTEEGVETTFAAHLLFGTYLLGTLAMPTLQATPSSRLVIVSSGGMYNTKFPSWAEATSTGPGKYDGQFAYARAKRGQVLLCEHWAEQVGNAVKVVSCHPGWVDTPGVESAYGANKSYLQPLRSLWQGAEGVLWLCVAPAEQLQGGAFYLDRSPQPKHLSGPFFTEGNYTRNTPEEVQDMAARLQEWACAETRPSFEQSKAHAAALALPLTARPEPIDLEAYMGDWYVLAVIPTTYELTATNFIDHYSLKRADTVGVHYHFSTMDEAAADGFTSSHGKMRGTVKNAPTNTVWSMDFKWMGVALPMGMPYLVLDVAPDYTYTVVGVPDRSYLWVMIRDTPSEFRQLGVSVLDAYPGILDPTLSAEQPLAPGEDGKLPTVTAPGDVEKRAYEWRLLRGVVRRVQELGYEPRKILRCAWHNEVGLGK